MSVLQVVVTMVVIHVICLGIYAFPRKNISSIETVKNCLAWLGGGMIVLTGLAANFLATMGLPTYLTSPGKTAVAMLVFGFVDVIAAVALHYLSKFLKSRKQPSR